MRTKDEVLAEDFGVAKSLPALIYFEHGVPNMYDGDLEDEEKLLAWILHQKEQETIELVNADILEDLIRDESYLVVLFGMRQARRWDFP